MKILCLITFVIVPSLFVLSKCEVANYSRGFKIPFPLMVPRKMNLDDMMDVNSFTEKYHFVDNRPDDSRFRISLPQVVIMKKEFDGMMNKSSFMDIRTEDKRLQMPFSQTITGKKKFDDTMDKFSITPKYILVKNHNEVTRFEIPFHQVVTSKTKFDMMDELSIKDKHPLLDDPTLDSRTVVRKCQNSKVLEDATGKGIRRKRCVTQIKSWRRERLKEEKLAAKTASMRRAMFLELNDAMIADVDIPDAVADP